MTAQIATGDFYHIYADGFTRQIPHTPDWREQLRETILALPVPSGTAVTIHRFRDYAAVVGDGHTVTTP